MQIMRASEFGPDAKRQMGDIFADGFYQWLNYFSKDKVKLANAFRHMFNLELFYVAVINGEMAGMAACTDGKARSVHLDGKELRKHLGLMRGTIAAFVLKREFEGRPYPFEIREGMGLVEFVATASNYRGQGVATAIMQHIFTSTPFDEYALEVADTNTNAVKLYEKLGFHEFMRVKQKHSERSGVNYLVYMKASG